MADIKNVPDDVYYEKLDLHLQCKLFDEEILKNITF